MSRAASASGRASATRPVAASAAAASSHVRASSRRRGLRRYAATARRSTSASASTIPRQRRAAPLTLATPASPASPSTASVTSSASPRSPPARARRTRSGPITGYSATMSNAFAWFDSSRNIRGCVLTLSITSPSPADSFSATALISGWYNFECLLGARPCHTL